VRWWLWRRWGVAAGTTRRGLNVHAAHAVHGRPVDALEAAHVDAGQTVRRIRGLRGRCGRRDLLRGGGGGLLRGRGRGHRHRVRRVTVAGQSRVRGEQLVIVVRGDRGRGGLSLRLRLRLGLLHGGQLVGRLRHRGGGHAHAERPADQHRALAQQQAGGRGRGRLHQLLGLRLLALHLLVLDRVEVDLAYGVHDVVVLERHEPEAAVPLGVLVHQHHRLLHLAELAEVRLHLVRGRVLADAAHEYLLGLAAGLRPVLGRRVLRVDLLAVQRVYGHGQHLLHRLRVRKRDESETTTPLRRTNMSHAKNEYRRINE